MIKLRSFLIENNLIDDYQYLLDNDKDIEYNCLHDEKTNGFNVLHKLVLLCSNLLFYNFLEANITELKDFINEKNGFGRTPLHLACFFSKTLSSETTVMLLIENGANVNSKDIFNWSPLHSAVRYSGTKSTENTVRILLNSGANINDITEESFSPLHLSLINIKYGCSEDTIKILLEDPNVDVNLKDKFGRTPLHIVIIYSWWEVSEEIISLLLEKGADYNLLDNEGKNPMFYARDCDESGNFVIGKILKKFSKTVEVNVDSRILQKVVEKYQFYEDECLICSNERKGIKCKYDHFNCFSCLAKTKFICQYCNLNL